MRAEDRLHRTIWQLVKMTKRPGVMCWHSANNPRSAKDGARLKRMGMRAGIGDLHFLRPDGVFCSLELKTEKGRASEAQLEWRDEVNRNGGFAAIAYGFEAARKALRQWEIIR